MKPQEKTSFKSGASGFTYEEARCIFAEAGFIFRGGLHYQESGVWFTSLLMGFTYKAGDKLC